MMVIHPEVVGSTGELLIASDIASKETFSKAPYVSRRYKGQIKSLFCYPFLYGVYNFVKCCFSRSVFFETELFLTKALFHSKVMMYVPQNNLHIFSEIDFLVVSSRGDRYLSYAFGPMEKYCF